MWMYIWFEVWNSVCWNDGSVKIVAGPSDHQGKASVGPTTILPVRVRGPALILKTASGKFL